MTTQELELRAEAAEQEAMSSVDEFLLERDMAHIGEGLDQLKGTPIRTICMVVLGGLLTPLFCLCGETRL